MAEEIPEEAAGNRPALDVQANVGAGGFQFRIKIDSPWLAAGVLGVSFLTLRSFYEANHEAVRAAVSTALAGLTDKILAIRLSSILVEFICNTKESYHAFMEAFKTGTVKQRLQEEFSKIGFKGELLVTIEDDNAAQTR